MDVDQTLPLPKTPTSYREKPPSYNEDSDDSYEELDQEFIVVGRNNRKNPRLLDALKFYASGKYITFSDTGMEHMHLAKERQRGDRASFPIFVVDNFDGDIFKKLQEAGCRILGPPAIITSAIRKDELPLRIRPIYCLLMEKVTLILTGVKDKTETRRLVELLHHMGGSIKKDFGPKVTHLIANAAHGEKYRIAVSMGIPMYKMDWPYRAWEYRDKHMGDCSEIEALKEECKLKPFYFSVLSFYGFSSKDLKVMENDAYSNGASVAQAGAPNATHLVIDDQSVTSIPPEIRPAKDSNNVYVVKAEWFWASIQMEAVADESMYLFPDPSSTTPHSLHQSLRDTPGSSGGRRDRKRRRYDLTNNLAQLAADGNMAEVTPQLKRLSSGIDQNISADLLDETPQSPSITSAAVPASQEESDDKAPRPAVTTIPKPVEEKKMSRRHQVIIELHTTEMNYTNILKSIMMVKEGAENPTQPGGALLNDQEIRIIFSAIPPLYEIHKGISDELTQLVNNYDENCLTGNIFLKRCDDLMSIYPRYVNYLERTKSELARLNCPKTNHRFYAFLKRMQSKPEFHRQTLKELMMRPVQRLPSVMLLQKELTKSTQKDFPNHPDVPIMDKAMARIEEVIKHINEDKRITEGRESMFAVTGNIENCPANLVSSHRKFVKEVKCKELGNDLSTRGEYLSLFIFTDMIQISKRRKNIVPPSPVVREPNATPVQDTKKKPYKHITMIMHCNIKRVIDIVECKAETNVIALVIKEHAQKEKLLAFLLDSDSEHTKSQILDEIVASICDVTCRTDYVVERIEKSNLQAKVEAAALALDVTSSLNRTKNKISRRISRAFSMKQTPKGMSRAMSSLTSLSSPFTGRRRDSSVFGGFSTPSGRSGSTPNPHRLASVQDVPEEQENWCELVDRQSLGQQTPQMERRMRYDNNAPFGPSSCKKRRESIFMNTSTPLWPPANERDEREVSIYHSPSPPEHSFLLNHDPAVDMDSVSMQSNFSAASLVTMPAMGRDDRAREMRPSEDLDEETTPRPSRTSSIFGSIGRVTPSRWRIGSTPKSQKKH